MSKWAQFFNNHPTLKNYLFWVATGATFFMAIDVDPKTLTSWPVVGEALWNFITNPAACVTFTIAMLGQYNNPKSGHWFKDIE